MQHKFDLQERTLKYALSIRSFLKELNPSEITLEDRKQLIRSSGSVGANYIEANESISPRDFLMRIKICKKEAKESLFWLQLMEVSDRNKINDKEKLIQETIELGKIFGAILQKTKFKLDQQVRS